MSTPILVRTACPDDGPELRAMQALSFRNLGAPWYEPEVIESFLAAIGTMDDSLLEQGTYYAAVADGRVGCGGWSDRTPGYAAHGDGSAADVIGASKATVRSIFVHPQWARLGIARTIMELIETGIASAGFLTAHLAATLSGVPLYRRLGYRSGGPVVLTLPGDMSFVCLTMSKELVTARLLMQAA